MSFPHDNTDDWLDVQLRAVPVPAGLHERLSRIADAPLAETPKVATPITLSARMLRPKLTNAQLDARLRDVPVPAELLDRLRAIAAPPRIRWHRLAVAAGLFLALSAAYFGSVGLLTWSIYEPEVATAERTRLLSMIEGYSSEEASGSLTVTWDRTLEVSPEAVAVPANRSEGLMPRLDIVEQANTPAAASAEQRDTDVGLRHRRPPLRDEFALADVRLSPNFALARIDGMTSPINEPDAVVHGPLDPRVSVGPRARGVDLPLNNATQKLFMLQHGLHPPQSVKEQPKSPVPLVRSTASYELWREYVERRAWPPADAIRTEDFLAAADLGGERSPSRPITVTMLGGPSPLGDGQNRLVQIGVQVRDLPAATHRPVHLTLAVDVSPNMQFGNRLEMVKRAIAGLAKELGPGDCLDLVRLHGDAQPLVEDVRSADAASWQRAVAALEVESTATNLAAGLMSALGAVQNGAAQNGPAAKGILRRLVIVGDGAAEWDAASRGVVEREAARAAAAGVALSLVHLSPLGAPDPRLVELALAGKGRVWHAVSEDPIRWALRETLTGRSQLVARDAKLTISFNPRVVASYRLLGHEPVAVAGLMPARMETDLYAGQSVVAVYEVSLVPPPKAAVSTPMPPAPAAGGQPAGPDAPPDVELASVVLQWRDPRDNSAGKTAAGQTAVRQAGQKIMRSQIRESLDQSPPALQMATLAVVTAEVLRNSPFASNLTLGDVLAWSRELRGPVTLRAAYRDFLTLVEQAEPIDSKRRVDTKRRGREGRPS